MSSHHTDVQKSALTEPISGLSQPSVNILGQNASSPSKFSPPVFDTAVNTTRGPFLAETANNIQLFTDIFNSSEAIENTINGVVIDNNLNNFLLATLGVKTQQSTQQICALIGEYNYQSFTQKFCIPSGAIDVAKTNGVNISWLTTTNIAKYIGNFTDINGKWVIVNDLSEAVIYGGTAELMYVNPNDTSIQKPVPRFMGKLRNFNTVATGQPPVLQDVNENTTCRDNAPTGDTFYTNPNTRDVYNLPLFLSDVLRGIEGVSTISPPAIVTVALPVNDSAIQDIFINSTSASAFAGRTIDVVVNPDSLQAGPSDSSRVMKVFNTKKFNFSDDVVATDTRSPTVLQSLNLVDRKADKNFDLANAVESNVWATGVGDWRNSQVDDPNITAQLSAAGYTESGSQALRRLNLIPVNSEDKIQVLSADSAGDPILVVDESAQVNLLEATWTAWQNITNLNTDVYGISATNTPDLSATALIGELSGNSVIENLNLLYNMYLTGGDGGDSESGTDFTSIIDALSARIEGNEDSIVTLNDALTGVTQVTELSSLINTLSSVDHVTIINQLSGLTQDLSGLNALSGDVDQLEILIDNINNFDIPALSSCCDNNSTIITDLSNKINNLSVTELSGIVDALSAIDLNTYITQLSSIEQQITNLSDIQVYVDQINNNTTYSDTLSTGISGLSADIYQQIDQINQQLIHTSVEELSAITQIINNIQNVDELIQALSGDTRISELSACCEGNLTNITQLTEQLNDYTVIVDQNTTNIDLLSSAIQEPAGVVLTTKNQTITGEKTFKSTMTVAASSYFEECMTVGDTEQPVVFNVYSVDGVTRVNIKNLPTISQINDLNPGDLYIRHVDGHDLLAVKQDPDA